MRIAIAGVVSGPFVFSIGASDPLPRDVSVATGKVRYTVAPSRTGLPAPNSPIGSMLVQMLTDQRIEVEAFFGSLSSDTFDGNARFFIR